MAGLDRIGLKHTVPQGSYFILIDISDFLALPQFEGYTDLEFCEWMINIFGVAAVPGSSFFKEEVNHLIRLHFARQKETLDEALNRLGAVSYTHLDVYKRQGYRMSGAGMGPEFREWRIIW